MNNTIIIKNLNCGSKENKSSKNTCSKRLKNEGFTLAEAENLIEAIERIADFTLESCPDFVLVDGVDLSSDVILANSSFGNDVRVFQLRDKETAKSLPKNNIACGVDDMMYMVKQEISASYLAI